MYQLLQMDFPLNMKRTMIPLLPFVDDNENNEEDYDEREDYDYYRYETDENEYDMDDYDTDDYENDYDTDDYENDYYVQYYMSPYDEVILGQQFMILRSRRWGYDSHPKRIIYYKNIIDIDDECSKIRNRNYEETINVTYCNSIGEQETVWVALEQTLKQSLKRRLNK